MLFHELYSSYFNAVAKIVGLAVRGELTKEGLYAVVREKGFAESTLTIPQNLTDGRWQLLMPDLTTPLTHVPTMPLTDLQRRWLKTLLTDPRIRLFGVTDAGLDDVAPLYTADVFTYYDRYSDGDPYEDPAYLAHFQTVLAALREKRKLRIRFHGKKETRHSYVCIPQRIEYSSKDDKFRLIADTPNSPLTVNLARVRSCELLDAYAPEEYRPRPTEKKTAVLELTDERNALERVMLHFSHFDKEAERLTENTYRLTLRYEQEDETELIIRVLSFGPMLRAVSPPMLIEKIRERIQKQEKLRSFD